LRRPEGLSEEDAEAELKVLLARLALHGVALDMCEHYTAAEAYRLLIEEICQEERAYAELRGTQWVQHFSTSDHCAECEAKYEAEWREFEEKEKQERGEGRSDSSDESSDESDAPF
jgi:hypothetical protein